MTQSGANINTAWASLVMALLQQRGITQIVVSPGSRSTPLTVAAARNESLTKHIHFDERGAAFYALGLAKATGKAAALICTSGSAVANYLPAVVEASMDSVPMLLLTADRPPELQGRGANQTIPQKDIFGTFTKRAFDIGCPDLDTGPEEGLRKVAAACAVFGSTHPGPVHINCPFREPLAPTEEGTDCEPYISAGQRWLDDNRASLPPDASSARVPGDCRELLAPFSSVSRGVIVAGKLDTDAARRAAVELSRTCGWPLLPDIQSGLRLGSRDDHCINYVDQLLLSLEAQARLKPDGVLHIGGRVTSKRMLEWLDRSAPTKYVRVDATSQLFDPNDQISATIVGDIPAVLKIAQAEIALNEDPAWLQHWQQANDTIGSILRDKTIVGEQLTELSACRQVSQQLADDQFNNADRPTLWAASSLPIRMFDMYADPAGTPVNIQANRGASGIDGTIASAAGYAAGSGKPVVLVIGDLAFLHDLNSLELVARSEIPIMIVLLNNNGGNIFSLLPVAKHTDVFEQYFITPHHRTFEASARQFDLPYERIDSLSQFGETFAAQVMTGTSTLLELIIDRDAGPAQMRKIADAIRGQLDGA